MALERAWYAVSAAFTANGQSTGVITVADVAGFYVGQVVQITSNTQATLHLKIRRVNGTTQLIVAPSVANGLATDVSVFLVADDAEITAFEQLKPKIPKVDQDQASYESEPINARRVVPVDNYGNIMGGKDNPISVDVDVDMGNLVPYAFDTIEATNITIAGQVVPILLKYYEGGPSGTLVATLTLTYDGGANFLSVQRT